MTLIATLGDSMSSNDNTITFGLSKDLIAPVYLKICYLQSSQPEKASLVPLSERFENPENFKVLSKLNSNSDLLVKVLIYDGDNNNLISIPVHTSYKAFNKGQRVWNKYVKLSINYNQLSIKSYLKFIIYEIVETKPKTFGTGYLSLFNVTNSTLRTGSQKIRIYLNSDSKDVNYGNPENLTDLEQSLIKFENGKYPRNSWLDRLTLSKLGNFGTEELGDENNYFLYLELQTFEMPIVYSTTTINNSIGNSGRQMANITPISPNNGNNQLYLSNTSIIINSIDIPVSKSSKTSKVYDPDFRSITLANITQNNNVLLDPIEYKYHKLERNINNNTLLDKEIKPSPNIRDELLKILTKPSNIELNETEKNLIWKFRYYFSKNNSVNDTSNKITSTKSFFPKFLKSINWNNDYELDHVFKEIIPNYWSVDKIQIGDALELLGNYFNPFTLCVNVPTNTSVQKDQKKKQEEVKFYKIFQYVTFLRKFAVERLRLASCEELLLYLLQLVQALKYESLIYDKKMPTSDAHDFMIINEINEDESLLKSPLAKFLIEKSIEHEKLGNFFYWYVKVENEDEITNSTTNNPPLRIFSLVLNKYIEMVKKHSQKNKLPNYKHLKRQIIFIKKLTSLVELLRSTFRKNEATQKKVEFLREYLSDSSNEFLKFADPFPLPLDPSVIVCGCYPEECSVFKSSLAPLKITLKTIESTSHSNSQIFGKKHYKYGKYPLMFKIGDDLRQDQLVIQIINLMDQLLKNENLDLKLTPYKILATSPVAGLIQFVPNQTLDSVLSDTYPISSVLDEVPNNRSQSDPIEGDQGSQVRIVSNNGILSYLRVHSKDQQSVEPQVASVLNSSIQSQRSSINPPEVTVALDLGVSSIVMDNYVKSCAGYCVITYILGVGDRHLDNLLLSPNGKFWHADFGYILGRDPKPFPPLMKLPIQVIDGMGGLTHENFNIFKSYCFITYTTLRRNSNLILNLFQLMLDANIPDIKIDPNRAIDKVKEKFALEMTEEEAILHFQNLINDSVNALLPVVIDRLHSLAQYWRA